MSFCCFTSPAEWWMSYICFSAAVCPNCSRPWAGHCGGICSRCRLSCACSHCSLSSSWKRREFGSWAGRSRAMSGAASLQTLRDGLTPPAMACLRLLLLSPGTGRVFFWWWAEWGEAYVGIVLKEIVSDLLWVVVAGGVQHEQDGVDCHHHLLTKLHSYFYFPSGKRRAWCHCFEAWELVREELEEDEDSVGIADQL